MYAGRIDMSIDKAVVSVDGETVGVVAFRESQERYSFPVETPGKYTT